MSKPKADKVYPIEVLGKAVESPGLPAPPVEELIARFQLDTEALIAGIRRDHQAQISEQDRKIGKLTDTCDRVLAEFAGLKRTIEEALHEMRGGVAEALNAQREAVRHATNASNSAAVFDKLKASQPDFHRMVRELDLKIAGALDRMTKLEGLHGDLNRRLDEFDVVAEDYEETKGTVRGLDLVVKDLNASDKARRRTEIRG